MLNARLAALFVFLAYMSHSRSARAISMKSKSKYDISIATANSHRYSSLVIGLS